MALFNNKFRATKATALGVSVADVSRVLIDQASSVINADVGSKLLSLGNESDASVVSAIESHFDVAASAFSGLKIPGCENDTTLSEVQREQAARVAMMYSDGAALRNTLDGVRKSYGLETVGNESFSSSKMTETRGYAVTLAIASAASRSSAGEVVYPTVKLNADFISTSVSLPRFETIGQTAHLGSGESITDFQRRHVTDAGRIAGILSRTDNIMRPRVVTGENESLLAPAAKAPYANVTAKDGTIFQVGEINGQYTDPINLLQLSRASGQSAAGNLNYNDRIDDGGFLEKVRVGFGAGDQSLLVDVSDRSAAQFSKLAANSSQNVRNIVMTGHEVTIDLNSAEAQAIAEVKAIADAGYNYMTVAIPLTFELHLHKGTLTQSFGTFKVTGVFQTLGGDNYVNESGLATALAAVAPTYISPIFNISLSSRTLRIEGLRVQSRTITKEYTLKARGVITAEKEINESNADSELAAMSSARTHAKESDAITHFISTAANMCDLYGTDGAKSPDPEETQMAGMFYLTQPWCRNDGDVTAASIVKELNTDDRPAKLMASISALVAENFFTMVTESGLITPVKTYAGESARIVPKIIAGATISRYLQTPGEDDFMGKLDDKVFGKPQVTASSLDVMDDRIMVIPGVEGVSGDADMVFGFGYCLESPDLVYDVPVDRDGGSARRLQLAPFYEFVTNMPLVYMVKITDVVAWLKQAA